MKAGSWYTFKYRQKDETVYIIKIITKGKRTDILAIDKEGKMRYFIGVTDKEISNAKIYNAEWNEKIEHTLNEFSKLPGVWHKFDETKLYDGDICRFKNNKKETTGVYYQGGVYFTLSGTESHIKAHSKIPTEFTALTEEEKKEYLDKLSKYGNLQSLISANEKKYPYLKKILKLLLDNGFKCKQIICKSLKTKKTGSGFKL